MITIDSRVGSIEMLPLFPKNMAQSGRLEFADAAFIGQGQSEGYQVLIGIERKTITDLLSSMTSGRLSGHQVPGLLNSYNAVYLIIEGIWRANPNNRMLEHYRYGSWVPIRLGAREFMAREIYNYLNTLNTICGITCWRTQNIHETVAWIISTYHWWYDKVLEAHKSHLHAHKPFVSLRTKRPSMIQRIASELPGIGFDRSRAVAKHFGSMVEMVLADEKEWQKIPGIGKKLACSVVSELQGKK